MHHLTSRQNLCDIRGVTLAVREAADLRAVVNNNQPKDLASKKTNLKPRMTTPLRLGHHLIDGKRIHVTKLRCDGTTVHCSLL